MKIKNEDIFHNKIASQVDYGQLYLTKWSEASGKVVITGQLRFIRKLVMV